MQCYNPISIEIRPFVGADTESTMIDNITKKPLRVTDPGNTAGYIVVPFVQLDRVKSLLDANKVAYWVDEEALSIDGKPEVIFINLSHRSDPAMVQELLDTIP